MSATILAASDFVNGSAAPYFSIPHLSFIGGSRRRTPLNGEQWVLQFEGTQTAVLAAYVSVNANFISTLDMRSGPVWGLTVTTSDDPTQATSTIKTRTYNLAGNKIQKDIREHPMALALGPEKIEIIDKVLQNDLKSDGTTRYTMGDIDPSGDMLTLYNWLRQRHGSMSYNVSQFVFQANITVARNSDLQIAFANVNKLYSFDQVIAETLAPSNYIISLSAIQTQIAPSIVVQPGFSWAWLKSTPTVSDAAGNKQIVSLEYELDIWPLIVYPAAS